MRKIQFTIFTPAYNRKNYLAKVYESILKQSYHSLEWVIQDDGSRDHTKEAVAGWIEENLIPIKYHYQENQGRFAAFNEAKQYFEGEWCILLDSDNALCDDALSELNKAVLKISRKKVSGIIADMADIKTGKIVGDPLPLNVNTGRIYEIYDKYHLRGDKALVFKNDILQKYSYPVYPGEKFGGDNKWKYTE